MEKQEILWRSVKDDGMPSEQEIKKTKNRFLCAMKTVYLRDNPETVKYTVPGRIECGRFLNSFGLELNRSSEGVFIARVTDWAEMPEPM